MSSILLMLMFYSSVLNAENILSRSCRQVDEVTITCATIPNDIPQGILKFRLHVGTPATSVLNSSTFNGENWSQLRNLELIEVERSYILFKDDCFNGLDALQELHINVWHPELSKNTFSGLNRVKTLDLTGCGKLNIATFKLAIKGSNILPNLQKIVLSEWNYYSGPYAFDDDLVNTLLPRKITDIDISRSQVSFINLTAVFMKFKYLEVFNASHATIGDSTDRYMKFEDIKHIKVLDVSHAKLPSQTIPFLPGKVVLQNVTMYLSEFGHINDLKCTFTHEILNFSGIFSAASVGFYMYNVTVIIDTELSLLTKTVKLQQNNLKRLDIQVICDSFYFLSIQKLDISDNGMEYLHPSILSCLKNLESINFSKNQLFKMFEENQTLFQNLFSGLKYLKIIRISENGLHQIPSTLFQTCKSVEEINLSYNRLKQVTFTLSDLENLKILDLQGNNIHILDSTSLHYLNALIPHTSNVNTSKSSIFLMLNPISCKVCEAKPFLQWLISTNLINMDSQRLKCLDENNQHKDINGNAIELVDKICKRKTIMISTCISVAVTFLISVSCAIIIYKRYKRKQKIKKRTKVMNDLRRGEGQHQFAVFLSFSNRDEDFVNSNILGHLDENLQLMTGIERTLVCTGDQHFRPGFNIHEETFRLLDSASVLIVVVSNNFLNSDFCHSEVNKAYENSKPVVLMLIEQIDPNLMTPTLKSLYQNNTRILWKVENGDNVLKTSWENVCKSVLDLI